MKEKKDIKILEVNNVDIVGKRFNGYDLVDYINKNTKYKAQQIVNLVQSKESTSTFLYDNVEQFVFEQNLANIELQELSTHSQLSISTNFLENSKAFKSASLVHYHMFHNSKFNLKSLERLANKKPTVITLHDMWFLTGRCAQPFECSKWKSGCDNCEYLDTVFPMYLDNCNELWKLKNEMFKNIDVDIVVASSYMLDVVKKRKIVNKNKIHLIPFGINLNEFYDNGQKEQIRQKYNIPNDNIVLFFRAQNEFKGTEYIVESLNSLNSKKKITLISCGELGLLDKIKDKYQIVELGVIDTQTIIDCYRACDMFLMTSKGESFGLMAIEAMACSRPVIVFDNTALKSVTFAPKCGVLVEDKNIQKLGEAIANLINDEKERIKRGKLGREIAEKHYDIDIYNKKIMILYEKVLKRKHNFKKSSHVIINYKNQDIQNLLGKLYIITKQLFNGMPVSFKQYFGNLEKRHVKGKSIIPYSSDVIQKLIEIYNNLLYEEAKNIGTEKQIKIEISILTILKRKIRTFIFLLKHDHEKLRSIIVSKIVRGRGGK